MLDQQARFTAAKPTAAKKDKVTRRYNKPQTRDYLDISEINQLIRTIRQHSRNAVRDELMVTMLFRHGLRVSELCALTWASVDLHHHEVAIRRSKSGKPMIHPIKGRELTLLRRHHQHHHPPPSQRLFISEQRRPVHTNTVRHVVRHFASLAELDASVLPVTPHALRRSCGFYMRRQGLDVAVIADRLGHRSLTATQRYLAVDPIADDTVAWT